MSRAFVKEPDGADAFEELPERPISAHPNLVTADGLARIEAEISRLQQEHAAAQAADDRGALARAARDLRYWNARRTTAQVVPPPSDATQVHFGSTVTIVRDDGRRQTFRIVGEDEADPAHGTLSHVSPLARALFGKQVGDTIQAGQSQAEIVEIVLGTAGIVTSCSVANRANHAYMSGTPDFACLATRPNRAFPKNTPNPDIGPRIWLCGPDALRVFKEANMATGTVKFFNSQKGFGFIQQENGGPDVFVHVSAVERAGMRGLVEGQKVSFDIEADQRSGKSAAANLQAV